MAATYILQALRQVSSAIDEVQAARATPDLTADQYSALTSLYFTLEDLHDALLDEEVGEKIDAIHDDLKSLEETVAQMQAAASQIQGVLNAVAKVAEVIATATQIIALGAKIV